MHCKINFHCTPHRYLIDYSNSKNSLLVDLHNKRRICHLLKQLNYLDIMCIVNLNKSCFNYIKYIDLQIFTKFLNCINNYFRKNLNYCYLGIKLKRISKNRRIFGFQIKRKYFLLCRNNRLYIDIMCHLRLQENLKDNFCRIRCKSINFIHNLCIHILY